jgi:hypothetical protein
MKGRSFVELDELFGQHVPTRKFPEYVTLVQREPEPKGVSTAVTM